MMWKYQPCKTRAFNRASSTLTVRTNHLDVKWKSYFWIGHTNHSHTHLNFLVPAFCNFAFNEIKFESRDFRDLWGRGIQDETLDIDTGPGDPWLGLGVTCQIQRQLGCISTQARHKPADKMQGVGHGDKIIIIWNILIPVEDRPG